MTGMKFREFVYERPGLDAISDAFYAVLDRFQKAPDAEEQLRCMHEINALRTKFDTMYQLCSIRHTIDTKDSFYSAEQDYFDRNAPLFEALNHAYYKALIVSPFRSQIEKTFGPQLLRIAEMQIKVFKPEITDELVRENQLCTQYTELLASASIPFEGADRNLSEMIPFMRSTDRSMRKRAAEARWGFLEEHENDLDRIFDELVKVRHAIAGKLGYADFIPVGYMRMLRSDYDAKMVAQFRQQVLERIVPLATRLRAKQAMRLGLQELEYYDEPLMFRTGNAIPKGSPEWIIGNGKKMYDSLSPETSEFFHYMLNGELMDLIARKGKAGGGYCTFISGYKSPFIFSNFNGTSADIDVLTHEVGHAFQVYLSRNFETNEYFWPTSDAAEIHSMSMEYFAYPWMDLFFDGEADKYRYAHLVDSVLFLPYGVSVDEFQHGVYENPGMHPDERKKLWRSIEKKYLPGRHFEGNNYLERGCWWQTQSHIFQSPFYYIDYTLAQICAFQFWFRAQKHNGNAFHDYVQMCRAGGSKSFLELVRIAGLRSPFAQGTVQEVMEEIGKYLDTVDDVRMN